MLNEIRAYDAKIGVGDVGEGRAALDVAQGVDARHIGFQPLIHLNEALFVGLYSGGVQVEPIGIGYAPRSQQQMRARKGALSRWGLYCKLNCATGVSFDAQWFCFK